MASFRCDEEILKTGDESAEDVAELRATISKLSAENDKYRQELHELHRKLETNSTMQSELVELNEALEQSLKDREAAINKRIHEAEDKQIAQKKLLQEKLEETEAQLARKSKENQDLRETLKDSNEKLLALRQADASVVAEDHSEMLRCEIERLTELLEQEADTRKGLEEAVEAVQSETNELRQILAATKGQLAEKNQIVESTKDELSVCRMELETLKSAPVSDSRKGNSLFAEVEDRRKMTLEQMTAMKTRYLDAKRSFQAKEAEIKALKAERAMLLRKWEHDTVEKIQQDARLCEKYKARITELERRLKDEEKKQKQSSKSQQTPSNNLSFLQNLVDAKKKEVEELQMKIENDAIQALLEEEAKHKMGKQLRYWRYRAMSVEAQLLSIKTRLECDPSSSNVELLETIETCLKKQTESTPDDNSIAVESSYRETTIANQTVVTLEDLMKIPRGFNSLAMDGTLTDSQDMEANGTNATLIKTQNMEETVGAMDATLIKTQNMEETVGASNATSTISQDMEETTCIVGQSIAREISTVKQEKISSPPIIDESIKILKTSSIKMELTEPIDTINRLAKSIGTSDDHSGKPQRKTELPESIDSINRLAKLIGTSDDHSEKPQRKGVRFTEETIDPPTGKPLKKQTSTQPKYPIIFISGRNKSKG